QDRGTPLGTLTPHAKEKRYCLAQEPAKEFAMFDDPIGTLEFAKATALRFAAARRLKFHARQDCCQEAFLAALKCETAYSPSRGDVRPFVQACVTNHLRRWWLRQNLLPQSYARRRAVPPERVYVPLEAVPAHDEEPAQAEAPSAFRALVSLL